MSISNIFIDVNCSQYIFQRTFSDIFVGSIVITEQLQSCEFFCFFFSIEPREQYIRTESYSWTFACKFSLRQKPSDDINVYE